MAEHKHLMEVIKNKTFVTQSDLVAAENEERLQTIMECNGCDRHLAELILDSEREHYVGMRNTPPEERKTAYDLFMQNNDEKIEALRQEAMCRGTVFIGSNVEQWRGASFNIAQQSSCGGQYYWLEPKNPFGY